METINYHNDLDRHFADGTPGDFAHWLFIHSIVKANQSGKILPDKDGNLTIEFRVNGVELPFMATLADLHEHLKRGIAKEAVELLKQRFGNISSVLDNFQQELTDKLEPLVSKLNFETGS